VFTHQAAAAVSVGKYSAWEPTATLPSACAVVGSAARSNTAKQTTFGQSEHCIAYYTSASRAVNDLYCVEWDVKLDYTIPYHTMPSATAAELLARIKMLRSDNLILHTLAGCCSVCVVALSEIGSHSELSTLYSCLVKRRVWLYFSDVCERV